MTFQPAKKKPTKKPVKKPKKVAPKTKEKIAKIKKEYLDKAETIETTYSGLKGEPVSLKEQKEISEMFESYEKL